MAVNKKMTIEVSYGNYGESVTDLDGNNIGGKKFISVHHSYDNGGSASPCDSREEALESLKRIVNVDCYGQKLVMKEKDIIFTDETGLFTLGEVLGQGLNTWFDMEKPKLTRREEIIKEREQEVKEHNERCEEAQKENLEKEKEWEIERKAKEKEHNKNYKDGSVSVILHNKVYYFIGDVTHCGRDAIKHNARKIRELMIEKKVKYGHKNCDDLPTFGKPPTREVSRFGTGNTSNAWNTFKDEQLQYEHDLYVFEVDEIKVAELIGKCEQTQIYCLDEEEENKLKEDLVNL